MKKTTFLLFFSLLSFLQISAQNPGCDGSRYKDDLFATVKKTTVPYATVTNQVNEQITLMMDVYEPQGDNLSARPVVILAHGGSFVFGDKADMKSACELLAKKGYIAASIQYRLYPFFALGFPDSIEVFDQAVRAVSDMKAAVRHFREDADSANLFRADVNNIFIGGYSAGAVTALHAGFLDSNDVVPAFLQTILDTHGGFDGNSGSALNQTYSSSIKAVLNMSGGIYRSEWVDAQNIPLASIHGTADDIVPFYYGLAAGIAYLEGSGLIHQKAEAAGLLHNLHPVPGGGHTNIYDQAQYKPHRDTFWANATTMMEFLVCQTSSVNEEEKWEENWSIFPNPATEGEFSIRLSDNVQRVAVTVADFSGKIIFQSKNIQNQSVVRLSGLPAGIYSIQIKDLENPARRFVAKKWSLMRQ
jgi:predicted esterase